LDQADAELQGLPVTRERSSVLSQVRLMQAVHMLDQGKLDDAALLLAEAREECLASDDPDTGGIEFTAASVDVLAGNVGSGLAAMLRVAREARDSKLESTGVTAYRWAAAMAVRVMDYATAEIGLREGLRYADEIEQSYCRHVLAATSAHVAWAQGRWDDTIPMAEIEIVERGSRRGTLGSRDALGFVAFGRGQVDRARNLLGASLDIGRASEEVELVMPALWGLAETALIAGEPGVAIEHCEEGLRLADRTGERALLVPFVVSGVRANLALRRPDAAERWFAETRSMLSAWEAVARPAVEHADGLIRLAAGSTVAARTALESAIEGWDARPRTWEATWARLDLAACLLRANRPAEALPVLRAVRALAERLDSPPLIARAQELESLARSRGAGEEPWRPLSAREYEIARLVAEGMTNGEIASRLGLSPKTVGAHVEHILAKLGAGRRAEIAAWTMAVAR
jgi:DNA-binding CsgD family transcriptional regulator